MSPFKTCILLIAAGAAHAGILPGSSEQISKWEAYKMLHGKSHSALEEPARFQRFLEADARIRAHNERFEQGLESFSMGHNQYTDLSREEFTKYALGLIPPTGNVTRARFHAAMPAGDVPATWDWKKEGRVTSIKDQAFCGACYAFAGAAIVEGYLIEKTGKSHDLSEQEIVDCSFKKYMEGNQNSGCEGGWPDAVFEHYHDQDIRLEHEYKYTSGTTRNRGMCQTPNRKYNAVNRMKYVNAELNSEDDIAQIVYTKGPIVIAVYADDAFQGMRGGIYTSGYIQRYRVNHAVVIVGFGEENGRKYWLIKNSWGEVWGVNGYGKILRGQNTCNLMDHGIWYVE